MITKTPDQLRAKLLELNAKLDGVRHPECRPEYRALITERRVVREEFYQALQRERKAA